MSEHEKKIEHPRLRKAASKLREALRLLDEAHDAYPLLAEALEALEDVLPAL
jgi:hypothetical protein